MTSTETQIETKQRIRKSNVRIVVTYFVVGLYCVSAVAISAFLFAEGENELALGVFNGLATLAAGIAGFWFGSRGNGFPETQMPSARSELSNDILIGPELGAPHKGKGPGNDDPVLED